MRIHHNLINLAIFYFCTKENLSIYKVLYTNIYIYIYIYIYKLKYLFYSFLRNYCVKH